MNKSLFNAIMKNLKDYPSEWCIQFGSAEREKPYVKIETYWNHIIVGGVSQNLNFFEKRKMWAVINDEAERRYIECIKPGKPCPATNESTPV